MGEAESLALAIEIGAELLLIDERAGRQIAQRAGLKITGILGILINAKKSDLISSVRKPVDELKDLGFRLNQRLVDTVLRNLGEID